MDILILTEGKIKFINDEIPSLKYDINKLIRCDFLFSDFILIGRIINQNEENLIKDNYYNVKVELMINLSDLNSIQVDKIKINDEIPLVIGRKTIGFYKLEQIIK